MLFRDNLAEERDSFSDWPKGFYEERDPEKRKSRVKTGSGKKRSEKKKNG